MALPKAHHIETLSEFNSLKFSYDSTNTHYFTGGTDTIVEGTPDILYTDIAYIKPLSCIYTHAKIYPCPVLEYDSEPTANSSNLVNSGNIKKAIDIAPRFYLGTCSTAGNVAIKQVDIPNFPTQLVNGVETPIVGSCIAVKFANDDSNHINDEPGKIKVNNTSAYPVWYNTGENNRPISGNCYGAANKYVYYIFNGTHWVWVSHGVDIDSMYNPQILGFGYASCTTAATTAAKTVSLSNYNLVNGGLVVVYFQYDVPAQATLNINSQGAKEIHFQGSRIAAGVIKAGDKCLFIYNGNYMLIAIDRWGKELQEKVSGINISETDFEALSTYEQGKLYFVFDNNS
jgi:hypothetical protein